MNYKSPLHKYRISRFLILFLCSSISTVSVGQNIEIGKWTGTIREENSVYEYVVNIKKVNGRNLEGITIASSKDFKCTSSFIGTVNNDTVMITETRVLTTDYSNSRDVCLMSLRLYIDSTNNIKGRFTSSNKNKSICGRGTVNLRMMKAPTAENNDEIESSKSSRIALSRADGIVRTATIQRNISTVLPDTKSFYSGLRKGILLDEIELPFDSIRIEVYDNGVVDGDVVSIVVNGVVKLSKVKLTEKPLSFDLRSNGLSGNTIEFFAENLGEIPPNTGLMVLKNSVFRKDVIFSSDFKSSSYIRIKLTGIPKD